MYVCIYIYICIIIYVYLLFIYILLLLAGRPVCQMTSLWPRRSGFAELPSGQRILKR